MVGDAYIQLYKIFIYGAFECKSSVQREFNPGQIVDLMAMERDIAHQQEKKIQTIVLIQNAIKQDINEALDRMLTRRSFLSRQDQLLDLKLKTAQATSSLILMEVILQGINLLNYETSSLKNTTNEN